MDASIPVVPHAVTMIPTNTYDLIWVVSTALILILLAIIAVFMQRLLGKIDCMSKSIGKLSTAEAVTHTELVGHIANTGVHCKDGDCLRRLSDATPS